MSDVLPQPPKAQSLKKYGLTQEEWLEIVRKQGNVCPICGKLPENGKLVTDHEHVRGFSDKRLKKKLFDTADKKKRTVRGCPCARCNLNFLPEGMTSKIARNVVTYLEAYEKRKLEYESRFMPTTTLEELKKEAND